MLLDYMDLDNIYREQPKNGLSPLCAFCSGAINILAMDNSWLYFIYRQLIYFAHSECMQNNVNDEQADGFAQWLSTHQIIEGDDDEQIGTP